MAFHRFAVPSYTGGLPSGYDYINNAVSGTPAAAAGPRSDGGPNNGTYFIGFGEDGKSEVINRGLKALAENTDTLDDLLRKDLAVPAMLEFTAVGAQTSIVLTGPGIFLGNGGYPNDFDGINRLFRLTDSGDVEPFLAGNPIGISSVSGGAIASGYSTGNITLNLTAPLTNGLTYRVHYMRRSNLASLLGDEFLPYRTDAARTLQTRINQVLSDFASQVIPGTSLIGGDLISGGGGSSGVIDLSAGTLRQQLQTLLHAQNRNTRQRGVLTSNDTLGVDDATVFFDTSGGKFNLQLPDPASMGRQRVHFYKTDFSQKPMYLVAYAAELIAGNPGPYPLDKPFGHWVLVCDGTDWYVESNYTTDPAINDFRLSGVAGQAVSDTDATTSVYLVPFKGNKISLYVGTTVDEWRTYTTTQITLNLGTLVSGKNYDVFAYFDDTTGTVKLELGAAWTDDTTRSEAIAFLDGVLVKDADHTRRLIGTIRTISTTQTRDSKAHRFIWNVDNKVERPISVTDTTPSWGYNDPNGAWRQANNSSANQVAYVSGAMDDGQNRPVQCDVRSGAFQVSSGSVFPIAVVGLGIDDSTTNSAQIRQNVPFVAVNTPLPISAHYVGMTQTGYHELRWLEAAASGSPYQFTGSDIFGFMASGILGTIWS